MGNYETNAILKRLRSIKSTSYPSREDSAQTVIRLRPEDLVVNRCPAAHSGDVNTSWLNVDFAEVRQAPALPDHDRHMPYPAPYGSVRVSPNTLNTLNTLNTPDTTIADRVREMAVGPTRYLRPSLSTPIQEGTFTRFDTRNADFSEVDVRLLRSLVEEQYLAPSMLNTPQTRQRIQESIQEQLREATMLHRIPTAYPYSVSATGDGDSVRVSIATIPTPFRVDIPPGELTDRLFIDDTADCRGPDTQITDEW